MKVSDRVLQSLRHLIETQQMKVGDRLPAERKLCEQLGVSRSSLREAIQQLTSQGMLVSKVGAGTYLQQLPSSWSQHQIVQPLSELIDEDPAYRFDVQEARIILEGGTAWHAALRATPEDIQHIRDCYDQITHFQSLGDDEQAARADANFHLAIAEASHNLVLIQVMRGVFDLLQFNVALGRRKVYSEAHRFDQLHEQHLQVIDAIERRDPEAARKAVCGHIEFVVQQVRSIDEEEARRQRSSRLNRI
ncbi:transcriptional regulator LldR [Acinetobacter tandoii]|jgi:GntR family L-lactate dehydrogenase operon transcriptional regulator|uniref:GntR family transcriptional regulator, L-lactate dehydrogenase operon regulator n=2 Tax=Acinetobacter tandoii TaxID=202954 RepID=R9AXP3_9GAMM|nr:MULTISPECIES: transcriptional regulator LldR [Acinetobacter]AUX86658.1 transcriptional regulator LldR [Acinetobacter sp. ACNIH2]EOR07039.1 GntR family transcriptional regulator, L-lactate dehydrogenase operon regulator [Acinetobacter tandoii DSM 14970 = CIP 107469]KAB1859683.1 transcriptional regulator LldR [Acinetobacter tandoii]UOG18423.1 transcriptional regulator LldR [Acinetobacter sp. PK01]